MTTVVDWFQDSNGNFEVSSAEHLKQLMNKGALYSDSGTPPADYWNANYVQTIDIDLLNDSTGITPIGTQTDRFDGMYDGGEYSISNYSYVDPNFSTSEACERFAGLFGYVTGYLKNIRLGGLWTLQGFHYAAGFLAGDSFASIVNVECVFENGTYIDTNSAPTVSIFGGVAGYARSDMIGITLAGYVDFRLDVSGVSAYGGGICGIFSSNTAEIRLLRNIATFPSGIQGTRVGGLFGQLQNGSNTSVTDNATTNPSVSLLLNAMTGDISAVQGITQYAGGIIGYYVDNCKTTYIVNSMTGNITGNGGSAKIGGIFGQLHYGRFDSGNCLNYMTGDIVITGVPSTSQKVGGLAGYTYTKDSNFVFRNFINAMNGSVEYWLSEGIYMGSQNANTPHVMVSNFFADTSFGLTFTKEQEQILSGTDNVERTGIVEGFLNHDVFTDLPYFDLTGTDDDGNTYDFEFVFGNLGGNSSFPDYTHLVMHRGDILTPYDVDYGLSGSGSTEVYLTYVNSETMTVYPPDDLTGTTFVPGVTIKLPPLSVRVRSINILVLLGGVTGSIGYKVTLEGPSGGEITKVEDTLEYKHNIVGLEPETSYTIRLYTDTGSGYQLFEDTSITTLGNTATNYDVTDFETNGVVNMSDVKDDPRLVAVINDLFTTGDIVGISLPSNPNTKSLFVRKGEAVNIKNASGTLLPFYPESGSGQAVSFVLSDNATTIPILYDETSDSISVNSVTYGVGDSFVLDERRVTVHEY